MPSVNTNRRGRVQSAATKEEVRRSKLEPHQQEAAKRQAAFKANKGKPLGEKSFNKGKPKSEWVKTAYERRQADATKRTQSAAAEKNEAFMKKHKRGKYSDKAIAKAKAADDKKHGITDKDTSLSKFAKRGGIAGGVNRWLKKQRLKVAEENKGKKLTRRGYR